MKVSFLVSSQSILKQLSHNFAEWQSTHPPYQLIPHTNSTPVHTWVDQLIPSPPTAITNSSVVNTLPTHPQPSAKYYQLIPNS